MAEKAKRAPSAGANSGGPGRRRVRGERLRKVWTFLPPASIAELERESERFGVTRSYIVARAFAAGFDAAVEELAEETGA